MEADLRGLGSSEFDFRSRPETCISYGRRDVPDRRKQALIVEPVRPSQHGVLDGLKLRQSPQRRAALAFNKPLIISASVLAWTIDRLGAWSTMAE